MTAPAVNGSTLPGCDEAAGQVLPRFAEPLNIP